jgi:hypothetical protein
MTTYNQKNKQNVRKAGEGAKCQLRMKLTFDEQQLNTSRIEGDHRYSGRANDFNLNCHDNLNQ